ncbi:hypothetical protein LLEC1_05075 [Akanthomyces lecanii]|uniref:Uncharacterized protein n=1 Tax=Cordyceps confragosa TaxID=2714763 RepID=A0A179IHD3_CORDF|nr:hypothetical protein LLEC1_05075 [Akanthomyces lecanii]
MSAHFCRQVYSSWRETHRGSATGTAGTAPELVALTTVKSNSAAASLPSPRSSFSSISSESSGWARPWSSSSSSDR